MKNKIHVSSPTGKEKKWRKNRKIIGIKLSNIQKNKSVESFQKIQNPSLIKKFKKKWSVSRTKQSWGFS